MEDLRKQQAWEEVLQQEVGVGVERVSTSSVGPSKGVQGAFVVPARLHQSPC